MPNEATRLLAHEVKRAPVLNDGETFVGMQCIPGRVSGKCKTVLMLSCWFLTMAAGGLAYGMSILLPELVRGFDAMRSEAALVQSLYFLVYLLSGLAWVFVLRRYGHGNCVVAGALIATIGAVLSSLAQTLTVVIVGMGIICSVGYGSIYLVPFLVIAEVFDGNISMMLVLLMIGPSVGQLIMPIVLDAALHEYGLSGTFLVIASMTLQCIPLGFLIRVIVGIKSQLQELNRRRQCRHQKRQLYMQDGRQEHGHPQEKLQLIEEQTPVHYQYHQQNDVGQFDLIPKLSTDQNHQDVLAGQCVYQNHQEVLAEPSVYQNHQHVLAKPSVYQNHQDALTEPSVHFKHQHMFAEPSVHQNHQHVLAEPSVHQNNLHLCVEQSIHQNQQDVLAEPSVHFKHQHVFAETSVHQNHQHVLAEPSAHHNNQHVFVEQSVHQNHQHVFVEQSVHQNHKQVFVEPSVHQSHQYVVAEPSVHQTHQHVFAEPSFYQNQQYVVAEPSVHQNHQHVFAEPSFYQNHQHVFADPSVHDGDLEYSELLPFYTYQQSTSEVQTWEQSRNFEITNSVQDIYNHMISYEWQSCTSVNVEDKVQTGDQYTMSTRQLLVAIFKDPHICLLFVIYFLTALAGNIESWFIVDIMLDRGFDSSEASFIPSMIGLASIMSRILAGVSKLIFKCPTVYHWLYVYPMLGLSHMLVVYLTSYWATVGACILSGIAYGMTVALGPSIMLEVAGVQKYSLAWTVVNCLYGLGDFVQGELTGFIRDVTGQYDLAFYMATAASLIMALLTVISAVISSRKQRQGWTTL